MVAVTTSLWSVVDQMCSHPARETVTAGLMVDAACVVVRLLDQRQAAAPAPGYEKR